MTEIIGQGTLYVRRDAGLLEVTADVDPDDADFIEVKTDDGSDTYDSFAFTMDYKRLTREMAEQLHAMGFDVPNDVGDK